MKGKEEGEGSKEDKEPTNVSAVQEGDEGGREEETGEGEGNE